MIEIRVDGKLLDIKGDDVTMQWQSFVFADAIGDQFSTDIELPRTDNNSRILQPFGLLDGVIDYSTRIRCSVSIDAIGCDGYMQVTLLAKYSLKAVLFLSPFPYEMLAKKIRDVVRLQGYIEYWDLLAPTSYTSGHSTGLQRTLYNNEMGVQVCTYSLRLSEFLTILGNALGVTFNLPFTEIYRVVASAPRVSPLNPTQTLYTYPAAAATLIFASQHVCSNVESPREAVENWIEITRDCTATFTAYSMGTLQVEINGVVTSTFYTNYEDLHSPAAPVTYSMQKGDRYQFSGVGSLGYEEGVCRVDFSNYAQDDTETDELVFPGYINGYNNVLQSTPHYSGYNADGLNGRVRLSWAYMDYWWCLGNMTVREFINALCHIKGQPVSSTGTTLAFASPKEAEADGEITEIRTTSDKLGKVTKLEYNDKSGALPQTISFANQFLSDEATIFKSIFYGATATPTGVAIVPMFESDGDNTFGCTWNDCGSVMLKEMSYQQGGSTYYALAPLGDQSWLGVDNITKPIEVTFETYTDLRDIIYLYFEGRKYMVVTADTDTSTGLCQVTAILMT